ncbi:hypothetical protein R1flu_010852 [Riccia fluitans]|uniref:Uncharacterized protein n=1 Tax=Riccia fluitans TaxID=41844 RepID=A0ABD1Z6W7_9MARC
MDRLLSGDTLLLTWNPRNRNRPPESLPEPTMIGRSAVTTPGGSKGCPRMSQALARGAPVDAGSPRTILPTYPLPCRGGISGLVLFGLFYSCHHLLGVSLISFPPEH